MFLSLGLSATRSFGVDTQPEEQPVKTDHYPIVTELEWEVERVPETRAAIFEMSIGRTFGRN